MATQAHSITVSLGESSFAKAADWSQFFHDTVAIEPARAPAASQSSGLVDDDDPVVDTTPNCGTIDIPHDPYRLFGTTGADRFEFKAGFDQGYLIANFEPGKDVIVVDGKSADIVDGALDDARALTEDAIDGFFYQQSTGTLSISNILAVQFVSTETADGTAQPALTTADFVIV